MIFLRKILNSLKVVDDDENLIIWIFEIVLIKYMIKKFDQKRIDYLYGNNIKILINKNEINII